METDLNASNSKETGNEYLCKGINESAQIVHRDMKAKGFWDNERNVGELLMLVTSELGEAMEAHRNGRFADVERFDAKLRTSRIINRDPSYVGDITPERAYEVAYCSCMKGFEEEIADAVLRLLDLSAGLGIDLEKHINAKARYNKGREVLHGKRY